MILATSWETFLYTECIKKPHSRKESKKKRSDIFIFCSHFCSEKLEKYEKEQYGHTWISVIRPFIYTFQLLFLNPVKHYLHCRYLLGVSFILAGDFSRESSENLKLH